MSEKFSKSIWQKLSESVLAKPTDELFLPFSTNFSTNAEAKNNIIKNLSVCLEALEGSRRESYFSSSAAICRRSKPRPFNTSRTRTTFLKATRRST